jgi:hypothetical protein
MATIEKPPIGGPPANPLGAENARLAARVRELEHQLRLERSRNERLERGLSALSERVIAMRKGLPLSRRESG